MKLKEEWRPGAKNKGEPLAHPHSSSSPGAALGSVPTVALSSAQVAEVYYRRLHDRRKQIDSCDGVDSPPPRRANPCGSTPARCVPWTWSLDQAYSRLWSGLESRRTIEQILSVSGGSRPSADATNGPRASTKGRVEARSHVEKNDRTDLADEFVTR